MITAMDRKLPGGIGEYTFFNIFHMGTIYTNWNIMLTLTDNGTSVAADAHPIINNKSVIHFLLTVSNLFCNLDQTVISSC